MSWLNAGYVCLEQWALSQDVWEERHLHIKVWASLKGRGRAILLSVSTSQEKSRPLLK